MASARMVKQSAQKKIGKAAAVGAKLKTPSA